MRWKERNNMIDNLYDKRTGKRVTIYAVAEDSNGYPKFLIREKNRWIWQSAKYYITEEENSLRKLQRKVAMKLDVVKTIKVKFYFYKH